MNNKDFDLINKHKDDIEVIWNALVRRDVIPSKVDAIVVGGCTNLGLSDRAADLYHAGVSDTIIISGYQPAGLPETEASFLARRCIELGVLESDIILENEATNTGQNIKLSASMLRDSKKAISSVVLIHKPYMSLRFLATAQAQWPQPQPKFYATCEQIGFDEFLEKYDAIDTVWKMLGDIKRMDEYVTLGFQAPQNIPPAAYSAYRKLVAAGFTTR